MNTISLIWLTVLVIIYLSIGYALLSNRESFIQYEGYEQERSKTGRRVFIGLFVAYVLIGFIGVLATLNSFNIARIPLINEVLKKLPKPYLPPQTETPPPTNGSGQPSSQPTFNEHQERMEKLKRDGF